jgi:hypothetical protein
LSIIVRTGRFQMGIAINKLLQMLANHADLVNENCHAKKLSRKKRRFSHGGFFFFQAFCWKRFHKLWRDKFERDLSGSRGGRREYIPRGSVTGDQRRMPPKIAEIGLQNL